MTTAARQRELPRRTLAVLAALVTVLATFGLAAPASASTSMSSTSVSGSTTRVAETRVGASTPVVEHVVGVAEHIGAGQRLGEQPAGLVSASATGVAAKSVTSAYDEALAGGRHAGFLKNYVDKPAAQIERGITSIERQIAEHQAKIQNPSAYIDDWASLDPRQQQALLTSKWPGDIARQQEQLDILRGILGSR